MTPGPWRVWKPIGTVDFSVVRDSQVLCTCRGGDSEANARAIAALPELIGAARDLCSELERVTGIFDAVEAQADLQDDDARLRAILARIEGGKA